MKRIIATLLTTTLLFSNVAYAQTTDAATFEVFSEKTSTEALPNPSNYAVSEPNVRSPYGSANETSDIEASASSDRGASSDDKASIQSISTSDGSTAEGDKVPGILYTLTLNANGGKLKDPATGKLKSAIAYKNLSGETVFLFDEVPFKAGYTFKGWNTKKNGKGTAYEPGKEYVALTQKNKGKVTLYAQWERIKLESIEITDINGNASGTAYPLTKRALNVTLTENCTYYPKLSVDSASKKVASVSYNKKTCIATVTVKSKKVAEPQKVTITAKYAGNVKQDLKAVEGKFTLTVLPARMDALNGIVGEDAIGVGNTAQYGVVGAYSDGAGSHDGTDVIWASSNAKVLKIDENGVATALKAGVATVKAKVCLTNGKQTTKTMKVTVGEGEATGLTVTPSKAQVPSWEATSVTLKASFLPKGSVGSVKYAIVTDTTRNHNANGEGCTLNGNVITIPAWSEPGDEIVVEGFLVGNESVSSRTSIKVVQGKDGIMFSSNQIVNGEVYVGVGETVHLNPVYKRSGEAARDCT